MSRNYRFGEFALNPQARELRRRREIVAAQPMVFDGICYLLEQRERAVGRDELIAAVWGRTDIGYSSLSQLVVKIRQTIGASGNDQRTIRTIPRFGYRWVAKVSIDESNADEPPAPDANDSPGAPHPGAPKRAWRKRLLLASFAAMALAGAFLFVAHRTASVESPSSGQGSGAAAVLPVDVDATGDWTWIRLGVMDLIGERLRSAGQAVVPSEDVVALVRSSATDKEHDVVRGATKAQYIVNSTASRKGDEWIVSLRLESANGTEHVAEARNDDVIVAAREASDHLLPALGRPVPLGDGTSLGRSDTELLARAKAALIVSDLDVARHLLESASEDSRQSPEWRRRMSQVDSRSNRLEDAARRLNDLLNDTSAEVTPQMRAALLNDSGIIEINLDRTSLAEQRFTEALSLGANGDDLAQVGRAHLGLGIAYEAQGDYERFGAELARARVAYTVTGDIGALASVEWNEGELAIRYNHYAAAKTVLDRAAERFDLLGKKAELALAQGSRIKVALSLLDSRSAVEIGTRAVPALDGLQVPVALHYFRTQWSRALISAGRLTEARSLLDRWSLDPVSESPDPYFTAVVNAELAELEFAAGHSSAALNLAKRAADALTLPDYSRERLQALLIAIRALKALGRDADAADERRFVSSWTAAPANRGIALYGKLVEAEQASEEGRHETAEGLYEESLRMATEEDVPSDIAEVARSYGGYLLARRNLDRAGVVIGKVAGFAEYDYDCAVLQASLYQALDREAAWYAAVASARRLAGERVIPAAILPSTAEIAGVGRRR
jgi:DNA-binding winged helix-turn-helix (wHTH) protein/tetratricopeptide (TPR) repeat protein